MDLWGIVPPPRYGASRTAQRRQRTTNSSEINNASAFSSAARRGASIDASSYAAEVSGKNSIALGRPSMHAPSISASDYHLHFGGGGKPPKVRYHNGPIDQRALTSKDPEEVMLDLEQFFEERGLVVLSTGLDSGEYRMKVMRPGFNTDVMLRPGAASSMGGLNSMGYGAIGAADLEGLPGVENLARSSVDEDYTLKKSMDAAAMRARISMDASRSLYNGQASNLGNASTLSQAAKSLKEKKRTARGAAKLALVIASLPVSLVKRIKYFAAHGPAWDKGFDGKTDLSADPVMNAAAAALAISQAKHQQIQHQLQIENAVSAAAATSAGSSSSSSDDRPLSTTGSSSPVTKAAAPETSEVSEATAVAGEAPTASTSTANDAASTSSATQPESTSSATAANMTTNSMSSSTISTNATPIIIATSASISASRNISLKDIVEASLTTVQDEIRFYVEIQKIKNLPGLYVVDFKRIRGDIWAFKRLYHGLVGDLPLKD
jgi:hypothetical protein